MTDFRSLVQRSGKDSRISLGVGSSRPVTDPVSGGGGNGNGRPANPGKGNGGGPKGGSDPFLSSVIALLHFEGTAGTATFTNSAGVATFQDNGGATKINNNRAAFGTCSLDVTGNLKGIVNLSGTGPYNIANNDYTIEFQQYIVSQALDFNAAKVYFDSRNAALAAGNFPTIYSTVADGSLKVMFNGADVITAGANSITASAFHHIALCRVGGNTKLFVDGTQVGSTWVDANTYVAPGAVCIGSASNAAGAVVGNVDEFRYTNGVGRYSANFTPDSAPFTP